MARLAPAARAAHDVPMRIRDFGVEIWMNRWETSCRYNLAETCVDSVTVEELLAIAGLDEAALLAELVPMRLGYGAIEGSERLRRAIAALYETASPGDVLVTHGAIGANALAYQALVEPGDVVISLVPTYQQHTSIPESLGAEVRVLRLREDDGWLPDLDELRGLAAGGVKVIALVNPGNPTGALLDEAHLAGIIEIAREAGAWILADEVYRGLDQAGSRHVPLVRGPLRAHGGRRQHVQGVLAGGPAPGLDRGAARGARARQPPPRLLGDQRGHGGRPAGRHRAGGDGRAARPQPADRAPQPRRSSTRGWRASG